MLSLVYMLMGRMAYCINKLLKLLYKIEGNINVIRQTACIVVNPITVNNFVSIFGCTPAGRASAGLKTFK